MGIELAHVVIPIARGVSGDVDARVRAPERLEVARDCRAYDRKAGALGKRFGFTRIDNRLLNSSATIDDEGPIRGLTYTNPTKGAQRGELLAIGHRSLFAYLPAANRWVNRGHVSPCCGREREIFRGHSVYDSADAGKSTSYVVRVASRQVLDASNRYELDVMATTLAGEVALPETQLDSATTTQRPHSPLCIGFGSEVVILWAVGSNGGAAGTLKRSRWRDSAPGALPAALADVTTNLATGMTPNQAFNVLRAFHGCALPSSTYLTAWIDYTSNDIELRKYDVNHTAIQSATYTGTFHRVAVADSPSQNIIYVLVWEIALGGGGVESQLNLLRFTRSTLTYQNTITLYSTVDGAQRFDNLGIVEGVDSNGQDTAIATWCVWTEQDNTDANARCDLMTRSYIVSSGNIGNLTTVANTLPVSQPFYHRGRCYIDTIVYLFFLGFTSAQLLDLDAKGQGTRTIRMAALHDVGRAPVGNRNLFVGAAQSVYQMTGQQPSNSTAIAYRCMVPIFSAADTETDTSPRLGYDEVEFGMDEAPTATPCLPGCAVIGGGYLCWYDGEVTSELGFAAPPFIDSSTIATPGGGIGDPGDPVDVTYYAHWEKFDNAGNLHRSHPSPGFQVEDVEQEWVNVHLRGYGGPRHRQMAAQVFRAGEDGIPKRVNNAAKMIENNQSGSFLATFIDTNLNPTEPIYTEGGIFESVAPEGARVVLAARDRLWSTDSFRESRVQYSQAFGPATIGAVSLAPEMVEPLSRIITSGERGMGLASFDDTTIVLTKRTAYMVSGYGPDRRGVGDDFSRLEPVPLDWGCVEPRSVCVIPDGVIFLSRRCFYLIDRGGNPSPIGEPVRKLLEAYPYCTSAVVVPEEQQARFTMVEDEGAAIGDASGIMLVYDYHLGEWFEWRPKIAAGTQLAFAGAAYVDGTYYAVTADGVVFKEDTTTHKDDTTGYVSERYETGWIQPAGPESWHLFDSIALLCKREDHHQLQVDIYYDYESAVGETFTLTKAQISALASPADRVDPVRVLRRRLARAIRIGFQDLAPEDGSHTTGAGFSVAALAVDVGVPTGMPRGEAVGRV